MPSLRPPWRATTKQTILILRSSRDRLAAIREAGFAVSTSEVDEGVTAIAVPVPLLPESEVFRLVGPFGLSIVGPWDRMLASQHPEGIDQLHHYAEKVAEVVNSMSSPTTVIPGGVFVGDGAVARRRRAAKSEQFKEGDGP